jgi:hypothetical protein
VRSFRTRVFVLSALSGLILLPTTALGGERVGTLDIERVGEIEAAIAWGSPEDVVALDPSATELAAATSRVTIAAWSDLETDIISAIGPDRFAGAWLSPDGTVTIGYVGSAPVDAELPHHGSVSYAFEQRERTAADLRARADADPAVMVRQGREEPAPQGPVVDFDEIYQTHKQENQAGGLEFEVTCATDSQGDPLGPVGGGQITALVTYTNQNSVRKFALLTAGHVIAAGNDCTGNGTNPDTWYAQDGDEPNRHIFGPNWTSRAIVDGTTGDGDGYMDAGFIHNSQSWAESYKVHLDGTPDPAGDWNGHNTLYNFVLISPFEGATYCIPLRSEALDDDNPIDCGTYGGYLGSGRYAIDGIAGEQGDSGAPVVNTNSNANAGPALLGSYNGIVGGQDYFYKVNSMLIQLDQDFTQVSEIEVCTANGDGLYDVKCQDL